MDYVVGSVAALISGNVTPNRPKLIRRALTPTKHPASPNVTPKSEFVEDRSIFLSPTLQKKKAIVKKSPKRIFETPDLDATENSETSSPKADKVKKHLKGELEAEETGRNSILSNKSPSNKLEKSLERVSLNKKSKLNDSQPSNETTPKKKKRKSETGVKINTEPEEMTVSNTATEDVIKKQKKRPKKALLKDGSLTDAKNTQHNKTDEVNKAADNPDQSVNADIINNQEGKKKNRKRKKNNKQTNQEGGKILDKEDKSTEKTLEKVSKKNKNRKNKNNKSELKNSIDSVEVKKDDAPSQKNDNADDQSNDETEEATENLMKKNHKNKKAKSGLKKASQSKKDKNKITTSQTSDNNAVDGQSDDESDETTENPFKFFGNSDSDSETEVSNVANPNAITEKDTDSEHDSDDDIESENEEINKTAFKTDDAEESSDDEEKPKQKKKKGGKKIAQVKQDEVKGSEDKEVKDDGQDAEVNTEEEIKRTLFVGNVPFSNKCKKEIKKIFSQYGTIETVRIRTVPVKDARVTPKLAIIRSEIHPDRSTVNVYVKFADPKSVERALVENNRVLNNHHLRVSRSAATGVEHDPNLAVFVGNLPFGIEDETLRGRFEKCGDIESVRIVRDKKTNAGKGFGYINFKSKDGVELALALSEEDLTVKNRIIRVKRCTQTQSRGIKKTSGNKPINRGPGKHFGNSQGQNRNFGNNQGENRNFGNNQGQNRNFGNNQGQNRNFGNNQGQNRNFGNNQGQNRNFGNNQGQNRNFGNNQGQNRNFGNNQGQNRNFGNNQGQNRNFGNQNNFGNQGNVASGASRRIMNKRPNQESGDGPPDKRPHLDQPREKKQRKEFVGMTAEKKKKQKFDKGQKKKKLLSEILTKKT